MLSRLTAYCASRCRRGMRQAAPEPLGIRAELLLGVFSFGSRRPKSGVGGGAYSLLSTRIHLRKQLRAHYRQGADERAVVRFVQPADEAEGDAESDDMLLLEVDRRNRSVIGKFLLQSAFFRFALLPQHRLRYIGRADDDAIVNVSRLCWHSTPSYFPTVLLCTHLLTCSLTYSLTRSLTQVSTIIDELMAHRLLRTTRYLVYGPLRNWFMWMPAEMVEVCWSTSPKLFEKLHKRMVEANG